MKIANEFSLAAPVEQAWPLLLDLERVAPAVPGVTVTGTDDEGVNATMKVRVGPVALAYRVHVALRSSDAERHVAVLEASGREARGQGTISSTVTATMTGRPDGTSHVALETDLAVTGRIAQFGGGVIQEVTDRLLQQFAERLAPELAGSESAAPANATAAPQTAGGGVPRPSATDDDEEFDLGRIALTSMLPGGAQIGTFVAALVGSLLGALLGTALTRRR